MMVRRLLRVCACAVCACALRLPAATTSRRAVGGGVAALLASGVAPARAVEEAPIDMDKIRALAAKRETVNMVLPKDADPRDRSLKDVVLGTNGAVIRCTIEEVKEMERVGLIVKDCFRGRSPDFYSLRDFTPRNWYSAPLSSTENGVARFLAVSDGRDYKAEVEAQAAALRASVTAKAVEAAGAPPPDGWIPPVKDDGTICGVGRYASKCADPSPGQLFVENAIKAKDMPRAAPPEKVKPTPFVEQLSKKIPF